MATRPCTACGLSTRLALVLPVHPPREPQHGAGRQPAGLCRERRAAAEVGVHVRVAAEHEVGRRRQRCAGERQGPREAVRAAQGVEAGGAQGAPVARVQVAALRQLRAPLQQHPRVLKRLQKKRVRSEKGAE
jgi:hypothetical protein